MSEMAEAIRQLMEERGCSEESVRQTIEKALKAAYKRKFGTDENAIVKFAEDMSDVSLYARKVVLDGVYDPVKEIELEEAREMSEDVEENDEIDILLDPKTFARSEISTGKQTAHQGLNENLKNSLMAEYKDKIGDIIIGYYQREKGGNIFVDLGNAGKVEGFLPSKNQSKLEFYEKGDRIKALITEIKPTNSGIQLVLSRTDTRLVDSILEKEVPEISDGTIEVIKTVRDPGYRTKIAVYSKRDDIDPVGACVGMKGVRIQTVIRELYNEKIDVLKWDADPTVFIKNALSPAQVKKVILLDTSKKTALAIVEDSQFSLAIGKQGQNVRLANRLCDWNIDVKTEDQAAEMDLSSIATVQNAHNLFNDVAEDENEEIAASAEAGDISSIMDLPQVNVEIAKILAENGFGDIADFVDGYEKDAISIEGVTGDDLDAIYDLIEANVELVEEDETAVQETETEEEEEEYFCPECGAKITLDMTKCPNCGCEFEFTTEEDGE